MSARHRDALAHLLYGVGAGGGFILLTGEVGTGKTTINRCVLEQLPENTDVAIILNPALNAIELLASACDELHIEYDHNNHTLKNLTDKLHRFLLENHARGRKTVLLIDEAQHLDFDVLEQIRLLTNLETNSEKLYALPGRNDTGGPRAGGFHCPSGGTGSQAQGQPHAIPWRSCP